MVIDMGLMVGVGRTKPTFPYDYYYGIEWDTTVSNPKPTRIGKMELHKELPLQNMMRRCILKDDGTVNYYLHANDSTKRDNGAAADLTGAHGQYMVELPDMYVRFEMDGNKCRHLQSTQPLPGFKKWRKDYISAVEATVYRPTNTLCAVVNNTADYRGGNNQADWDALGKTQLGKPATNINLNDFRAYARKRGSTEWNCNLYQTHKKLWWLFAVEYATFNSQGAYNAGLDVNGYRQGGLGNGVTKIDFNRWSEFNSCYPFVPCGITNSCGNHTGIVSYIMPHDYGYDSLVKVDVPSYRGVENPFGHICKLTDGCKCLIQSEAGGGLSEFYVCEDPAAFMSSGFANYKLRGNLPRNEGYAKQLILGDDGDIMPLAVGAGSTAHFCDYFNTDIPSSGESERGMLFGGRADEGASAGFLCVNTNGTASDADASVGSRLCFYPRN